MATDYPGPDTGGDKTQSIPKKLMFVLLIGIVAAVFVTMFVLMHNHGGTSSGKTGQPADSATGPQLGTEGPANGRSMPAGAASGTAATGQGGGPGAMGSGAGVGSGTPGSAGTRTGGASSGSPAAPNAGAPGASAP